MVGGGRGGEGREGLYERGIAEVRLKYTVLYYRGGDVRHELQM